MVPASSRRYIRRKTPIHSPAQIIEKNSSHPAQGIATMARIPRLLFATDSRASKKSVFGKISENIAAPIPAEISAAQSAPRVIVVPIHLPRVGFGQRRWGTPIRKSVGASKKIAATIKVGFRSAPMLPPINRKEESCQKRSQMMATAAST